MPTTFLEIDYNLKLPASNFDILRIEEFLKADINQSYLKNHKTNFYILMFITNDVGRHAIDYNDFYYEKGTVLAIRKDQIHHFYSNPFVKGYLLLFREEFLNSYLNESEVVYTIQMFNELLTSPKTQLIGPDYNVVVKLLNSIEIETLKISDEYSQKIIRSLLHILITLIHRIKSQGYNKVQLSKYLKEFIKFQSLLEKNYRETKKVAAYAQMLGFSSKKLNSIVKYVANKPVKNFIDEVIIIKIKRYLLHTNLSVKEIAFEVGFYDPTNLYKYFKKHTKFTPDTYKKRYKE